MNIDLLKSPLHNAHVRHEAKFAEFGGWNMPLSFATGTLEEHRSCRTDSAIFDVSHLGSVRVRGDNSFDVLQKTFTNNLERIAPGKAQYSHLLNNEGGVVDDVIIWWVKEGHFEIMPNASNTSRVTEALTSLGGIEVTEITHHRAVIAIQGPKAREHFARISEEGSKTPRFCVTEIEIQGSPIVVAGTGYTGEDGVELSIPIDKAEEIWERLIEIGSKPAGLGARDTLRLEAGLPLHGNDLSPEITPIEANFKWVVAMEKPMFPGRDAIQNQLEKGISKKLYALSTNGRRPPRSGQSVIINGSKAGTVTSGNYSPMLEHGIALALLPTILKEGDTVLIETRSKPMEATVVQLPFYTVQEES